MAEGLVHVEEFIAGRGQYVPPLMVRQVRAASHTGPALQGSIDGTQWTRPPCVKGAVSEADWGIVSVIDNPSVNALR